jgi:outer membrane receptor protein involved in Fe transport
MFKKIYSLIVCFVLVASSAFAQSGTLSGKIVDKNTGETLPFVNVVVEKNGVQSGGTSSNFDGEYSIKPLDPGTYTVKASFVGYGAVQINGVIISSNKITFQNIQLSEGVDIAEVEVIDYKKPLLDQDNLGGKTVTSDEIAAMPTRSVTSIVATTAGVYKQDENSGMNVRGSRDGSMVYYVDGMKVRGGLGVPQSGIEQITVITGGVPAQYGDVTAGVTNIVTKGPSQQFYGGLEYVTSQLFDKSDYNLIGFGVSGPILKRINDDGSKGQSILGYFISGEATSVGDRDPSAIGVWKLKDEVRDDLLANPFRVATISEGGQIGLLNNADFLRNPLDEDGNPTADSDFELIPNKINNGTQGINLSGKLEFKPSDNVSMAFGGSFAYNKSDSWSRSMSLMSWDNMSDYTVQNWRAFGRLTQKFGAQDSEEEDEESASTIKNAYYTLQADYSKYNSVSNPYENGDLFDFGYVGKFETYTAPFYIDSFINGDAQQAITTNIGFTDTLYTFTQNGGDEQLAAYTQAYYDLWNENIEAFGSPIRNQYYLQGKGLTNGGMPSSVYSLWSNVGTQSGSTSKYEATQQTIKAHGAADVGNHEISFGFEYERRSDRSWGLSASSLWGYMRQLANTHIMGLDDTPNYFYVDQVTGERIVSQDSPWEIASNYTFQDTVFYDRLFVEEDYGNFAKNLRGGLGVDDTEWIDIDSYDPETFKLEYFNADELLNEGNSLVSYYGYDHLGNKVDNVTLEDFFNEEGEDNPSRLMGAFEPIYMAGYIQDKFAFDDLIFNVGVRVDRYDANQQVLKDPYLLHTAYTAGEVSALGGSAVAHPSNIGDDFVVYVDDFENPNAITGYRSGKDWYDANGLEVSDPSVITQLSNGAVTPYLIDDTPDKEERFKAFRDYEPELVFMPRVSFSFPISDEAQFFAHYDVLTQRPGSNRLNPAAYYFMDNSVGTFIENPDLKVERTVDYSLGFAQTLTKRSSLTLSAFYKEMKDLIAVKAIAYAYPSDYMTMSNQDFGTVKGFTAAYDLRRTGNVSLTANYTLQFAEGTGSGAFSAWSLINTGMPNLRTLIPLSYDQRHALTATIDYKYASGKDYNGPLLFDKQILANAGANLIVTAGSGTPFSKQANITQEAASGINDRSVLEGSINGSRLPWTFRVSSRFSKRFDIEWDKKDGSKKRSSINVYLQVQNLFNNKNLIAVYRATGNPDDDGYLTDASVQSDINAQNDPQSFRDLYRMKVNNPNHYSLPRVARLGVSLSF